MKHLFNSFISCLLVFVLCLSALCSCAIGKLVKIPDIEDLDVVTAKTILGGKGLIPKVEYEYHNNYEYDTIIRTSPTIGSAVEKDTPVILYVCKGPSYYELPDSVGYMRDIDGIENFIWWSDAKDGQGTKGFTNVYVKEGYLYIKMYLCCKSEYKLEFYGDFGTASVNDSFDKTIPIKVIYNSKKVDNKGGRTDFEVKIPLSDLGVQKPTNINIKFDFLVNEEREAFQAGFDLTW